VSRGARHDDDSRIGDICGMARICHRYHSIWVAP
jgi:hypothetical protein